MKKKKKYILLIIIAILFITSIVMMNLPRFNKTNMVMKYAVIYLFLAFVTLFSIMCLFYILKNRFHLENKGLFLLKGFTFLTFIIVLFIIGQAQLKYIDKYETPPIIACSFYDKYNNLIYTSQYMNSCPELEDIKKTESSLSFTVNEQFHNYTNEQWNNGIFQEQKEFNAYLKTDIEIEYNSNGQILHVLILSSSNIEYKGSTGFDYDYFSIKREIKNVYEEDSFTSVQDNYIIDINPEKIEDISSINHYNFTSDDLYRVTLSSKIAGSNGEKTLFEVVQTIENKENIRTEPIVEGYFVLDNDNKEIEYSEVSNFYNSYIDRINLHITASNKSVIGYLGIGSNFRQYRKMEYKNINNFNNIVFNEEFIWFKDGNIEKKGYELYRDGKNTLIIEGKFELFSLQKTNYGLKLTITASKFDGYIGEEYKDFVQGWTRNRQAAPFGRGIEFLFNYGDHLIFNTLSSNEIIFQENPLISIYYD